MAARFSTVEAATAGLRSVRERPRLWVGASLLFLIGSLAGLAVAVGPAAPVYSALSDQMAQMGSDQPTPEAALRVIELYGRIGILTLPATLIWMAFLNAAVYRAALRPEPSGRFYLGAGIEEFRQLLVQIALWGVLMVATIAVSVILAAVAALAPGPAAGLIAFLGVVAMFAVAVHLWTRLSLATAATFAENGLRLARSWRLTEGSFWRILAAYVLAALAAVAIAEVWSWVVSLVTGGVMDRMGQGMAAGGFDTRAFLAENTAAMILSYALNAPAGGLQMILTLAPGAAIYRALAGPAASRRG
jgi:hypothetical protein